MVSDVLLLSYLDKIGLSLTGEAGQASAFLYSEARLYKGACNHVRGKNRLQEMVKFKTGVSWAIKRKNSLLAYNLEFIANKFCPSRVYLSR